jgi:hypothetical protein
MPRASSAGCWAAELADPGRTLSFFDAFSSREPVATPDQVRGRLSLENAMALDFQRLKHDIPANNSRSSQAIFREGSL